MIYKKKGQGVGKINVPGGKLQDGESEEAAAIRECEEETGLTPHNLQLAGRLEFYFPRGNGWDNHCAVFRARDYSGTLISETDECTCEWVRVEKIPYEKMWDSDRVWTPLLLEGKIFHRSYEFDEKFSVAKEKIII